MLLLHDMVTRMRIGIEADAADGCYYQMSKQPDMSDLYLCDRTDATEVSSRAKSDRAVVGKGWERALQLDDEAMAIRGMGRAKGGVPL